MEDRMLSDEILLALIKKAGGSGGTDDYEDLENKPKIGGVELSGNKSLDDLGIASAQSVSEIKDGQEINSFGDVESALADKTDDDAVAPEFDNTVAYSAGNLVYHDGTLYKFDSDHAAGAWDASEVSPTTVAAEFNQLKNTLAYKSYGQIDTSTVFRANLCKGSNIAFLEVIEFISLSTGETVLTGKIPAGYRPKVDLSFTLIERGLSARTIAFKAYPNGNINLYNYGSAISSAAPFGGTLSWPIGS